MKQKRLVSMLLVAALCTTSLFAIDLSVGGGIDFTHATKKAEIDTGWFKVSPKATGNFFGVKCFFDALNRYHKSADLKTRKIKEGKIWSSTIKNLRNRHCYCQMR